MTNAIFWKAGQLSSIVSVSDTSIVRETDLFAILTTHIRHPATAVVTGRVHIWIFANTCRNGAYSGGCFSAIANNASDRGIACIYQRRDAALWDADGVSNVVGKCGTVAL